MNKAAEDHQQFDEDACLRAALPKTIFHIDGSFAFELDDPEQSSHENNPQEKPKTMHMQASCRITRDGIFQRCYFGHADLLRNIETDQLTKAQVIKTEDYFASVFDDTSKSLLVYRELTQSSDDTEPTRLIHLGDRQHKHWEYFQLHNKIKSTNPHVGFVIRLQTPHNNMILTDDKLVSLEEHMESQPVLSQANISIQEKYHRLELRSCRIKLASPQYKDAGASVPPMDATMEMTCVLACFADDPSRKWFLTSNEGSPAATAQDALMIAGLYAKRWYIEEFFQMFQTVFPVKQYLTNNANLFMTDVFVRATYVLRASQLYDLFQSNPKQKAAPFFTPLELKSLHMLRPEYDSIIKDKECKQQHELFLDFLNYDVKEAAILITQLGSLKLPEIRVVNNHRPKPDFETMIKGYALLHHWTKLMYNVGNQIREQTNDFKDPSPNQKITIKI